MPPMSYKPRNERNACVCGSARTDIGNFIWQVQEDLDDPIHHAYYYRCPVCASFSSANIYFPIDSYNNTPIEAFHIPEIKHEMNAARIDWILSCVKLPEDAVLYDLGAGEGCFSDHFTRKVPKGRAVAVEADGRMQEKFYGTYERVEFVEVFIEAFLRETNNYPEPDVIAVTDVLEHVVEPEQMLRLIASTLKPGGFVYITVPNSRTFGTYPRRLAPADVDWDRANHARQHLWMLEPKIISDLVNAHFDIIEQSRTFDTKVRQDGDYSTILAQKV
jgi:SAM-dependent methyltransferase